MSQSEGLTPTDMTPTPPGQKNSKQQTDTVREQLMNMVHRNHPQELEETKIKAKLEKVQVLNSAGGQTQHMNDYLVLCHSNCSANSHTKV